MCSSGWISGGAGLVHLRPRCICGVSGHSGAHARCKVLAALHEHQLPVSSAGHCPVQCTTTGRLERCYHSCEAGHRGEILYKGFNIQMALALGVEFHKKVLAERGCPKVCSFRKRFEGVFHFSIVARPSTFFVKPKIALTMSGLGCGAAGLFCWLSFGWGKGVEEEEGGRRTHSGNSSSHIPWRA